MKVFISFQDERDKTIEGYFELVEQSINYIKIKSGMNTITIPYHKLNKMKREVKNKI